MWTTTWSGRRESCGSEGSRRRWLRASSTVCSALVAFTLAGCGSGDGTERPALPPEIGQLLAGKADAVTASLENGDVAGARAQALELRASAVAAVEAGTVPGELRRPLLAAVNRLLASIPAVPAPPPTDESDEDEGDEHDKGKKDKDKDEEEQGDDD